MSDNFTGKELIVCFVCGPDNEKGLQLKIERFPGKAEAFFTVPAE